MRSLSLTLFVILSTIRGIAQPWLEHLPSHKSRAELTFFDYQNAFEKYWAPYHVTNGTYVEDGVTKKAPGWKQFKRWEYMMEHRANMITGEFPKRSAYQITKEYFANHSTARTSAISDWKPVGPTYSQGGYEGIGRMNCVAFHPTDENTYWAGAASGGLWVTTDDGATWNVLTDKTESLGLSDIVITKDFETSKTIYLATGDRDFYDNMSIGVLKSTDGGQTWNNTSLTYALADRKFINRLLIHPAEAATLLAATVDGVLITRDGGVTWDEVLTELVFIDMEFHPSNPAIIYGATLEGEIYKSNNNGDSWTRTLNDFPGKRTEIAVTPAAPDWVYAITVSGGMDGVYKSENSGSSFTKLVGDTLNMLHWDAAATGTGGQGYYDLAMDASPIDPNVLVIGGINTWRSMDGGVTWKIVNHFAGNQAQAVHADKHSLRFRSNGDLYECNDGGIYVTYDLGETWIDKSNGIAISQMYKLGVSATDQDEILTGLQDNGSKLHSATGWRQANGGDGMEAMIDYSDVNIQYTNTQSGIFRTYDRWESARYVNPNGAGAGAWVIPWAMDPEDPKVLYGGFADIWKTTDRGDSWTKVSTINYGNKLRSIAIAPSDPNIVYIAGTYNMWKSTTGGEPFNLLTGNVPDHSNALAYISVKHDDPQTLWVAVSSFFDPGVFQSVDGGETWTDITAGLPEIPVYTVIQNRQATEGIELFAGTELGVYHKKGDEEWVPFSNGLPNVIVSELEMYYSPDPTQSKLRAATYGRGLWETRIEFNSTPMVYVSSTTKQNNTTPLKPNQTDQEILKIEIHAAGDLEPLHMQSMTFNTNGSTNPLADIRSAKVYYTGSANGFITNRLFGEMYESPDGTFTITGDQPLINGVNYFWLAYDIPETATIHNYLDAQCESFNMGTEVIPDVISPDGNRQIQLIYCPAGSTNLSQDYISRVSIGTVSQSSMKGENGYQDFTSQVIEMEVGVDMPIFVTNNAPHSSNELLIWADWNIDGDFEDQEELLYATGPLGITIYNTFLHAPAIAKPGLTRMRIRLHDTAFGPNATPCDVANLGEVEDYSVLVTETMVGTQPGTLEMPILIYPNPAKTSIQISIPESNMEHQIRIMDLFGKVCHESEVSSGTMLDISDFFPGVYFLEVNQGTFSQFFKFVKAE